MVLIHFHKAGRLELLGELFGTQVFTAEVITVEELGVHLAEHPENTAILESPWLVPVTVDEPSDIQLVAELRSRWGSADDKDRGEAEIVALCKRYGWTALTDDDVGRTAATDEGVARVYMLTVLIAAAAHGLIHRDEAWKVHCAIEKNRRRAILVPEEVHRPVFKECVEKLKAVQEKRGKPPWPELLAVPRMDDLIRWVRDHS